MADVIVIGAGLAGLRCAGLLAERGLDVEVVDADDGVGGRVRTDVVDGFRLDRGFQVLFDGYPEAQRALDLEALDLRAFDQGADVWWDGRMRSIANPLRDPRAIADIARAGIGGPADLKAAAQWLREARPVATATAPDVTGDERLRQLGFSESVRERFLRPLYAGVFLDRSLGVSSRLLDQCFMQMAAGRTVVPARGMGAISEQLAARLPGGSVHLGERAEKVGTRTVTLTSGTKLRAKHAIVLAAGPEGSSALAGLPAPEARSSTCLWYDAALDAAARAQLTAWFGGRVHTWRLLRVDRIAWAQHAQPPGAVGAGPRWAKDGLVLAGDLVENASIDGALRSGRRAAELVLGTVVAKQVAG